MTDVSEPDVGDPGECLNAGCEAGADLAAVCDTGQVKHYCGEHGGGRRAGHAWVEEWVEL